MNVCIFLAGMVAATVTPQHLLMNRNAIFQGGLQPHNYCLPVLKREVHSEIPDPYLISYLSGLIPFQFNHFSNVTVLQKSPGLQICSSFYSSSRHKPILCSSLTFSKSASFLVLSPERENLVSDVL